MEMPFQIKELLERIESAGYKAYLVGGCVRDSLMGAQPHDFDIAASSVPSETARIFADCRVIETGIKHGTVTVLYKGLSIEITTFRVDGEYSDGRHPESVSFSSNIEDDLSRRDFTINGMAYGLKDGFIDPFGGKADIGAKIIRCIGDPDKRFSEDALRILRALRFSARLGFTIEEKTKAAMLSRKSDLKKISAERIFSELQQILCGNYIKRVMLEFHEIFSEILPPLAVQVGYDQNSKYHNSTLYEHTARAVEAAPCDPLMRLVMLFHDMGKPQCRTNGEDGAGHYYSHADASMKIADELLRRFKCDNSRRITICEVVKYHDIPIDTSRRYIRKMMSKIGYDIFRYVMLAHMADDSAKADFVLPRVEIEREILDIAEEIASEQPCLTVKDLAVSGRDLSAIVPPSPKMGEILKQLLGEVVEETLPNEKNALIERAKQLL
ncbi:MAG: HD domain-containing protein [Oscillospiraceae bacterium]|nr:HD domain-containing protein [Oscillospiraceae bacterium]